MYKPDRIWIDECADMQNVWHNLALPKGWIAVKFPHIILDIQAISVTKKQWTEFRRMYRPTFRDDLACATWFVPNE